MEEQLQKPIKELISAFPQIGVILEEYRIGCVPCSVGSCLLKDIVEIHNLSEEEEQDLMVRIARVMDPEREVQPPKAVKKARAKPKGIKYSPPMKTLVDEHLLIKRWIAMIPEVVEDLDLDSSEGRQLISDGVYFIRSYADRFHHAKEEDILFRYFDENLDILKTMLEDHQAARAHAQAVSEALEKREKKGIVEHLLAYRDLLTEHIKKEDEILYPWMDRNLSITQVGELFSKFNSANEISGKEVAERCRSFVIKIEERFEKAKKEVRL